MILRVRQLMVRDEATSEPSAVRMGRTLREPPPFAARAPQVLPWPVPSAVRAREDDLLALQVSLMSALELAMGSQAVPETAN